MNRGHSYTLRALLIVFPLLPLPLAARAGHFPGEEWETCLPGDVGMDAEALDALADALGGRGCVVKDGFVVKTWGDQAQRGDWLSSAKPVLSTLLFFAIQEGKVKGVDQPIADFGWPLEGKDRHITFRHLGAMSSGYARPEGPGEAWAYNDFAIMLYQKTLFDMVFKHDPDNVAADPARFGALHLQDGLKFNQRNRRLRASVRDFARIAWFWLNRGYWDGKQVLPSHFFDEYMRSQTARNLPQSAKADTNDYLNIGSFGGGSDHFTKYGAGIYGFNWWFNEAGRLHPDALTWPDAPKDTIMSIGFGGNCSVMIPSLNLVLVSAGGDWGNLEGGNADSKMNRNLALLARSVVDSTDVNVSGEMKKWHPVTLTFTGPETSEQSDPNPFTDFRLDVTFRHGDATRTVPGYFAADGNAAESGADVGSMWRVHFLPDSEGEWTYQASFRMGPKVVYADEASAGTPTAFDGTRGRFFIGSTDKKAPDNRGRGLLRYVGKRYLQFVETGEYYLKGGADSPENILAFADFDQTPPTHTFAPHAGDWREGDPVWRGNKGKNLIGALNYLAGKSMNVVYFLTMNVKGDGKDVWPWTSDDERFRFDCSKLDQWNIVFDHMDRLGILLHVVQQEQENDQLLDGGDLGPERKLYYRELIARFAHRPALVWNLGEENTNTLEQQKAFMEYIRSLDAYDHPIVLHTFPSEIDKVYTPLLGFEYLDGPSLQRGNMERVHQDTLKWTAASAEAGHPWFVCSDEIGPANTGVKPDADDPEHNDVRRYALWGNLMAGGSGAEWLFGYKHAHNDINCEDWRSRDIMWDQTRHALEFFQQHLPFTEMTPDDALVRGEGAWCLAKPGEIYAVYAPVPTGVQLLIAEGTYSVDWYNPRKGGALTAGQGVFGPGVVSLGAPPRDSDRDWVILVRRKD